VKLTRQIELKKKSVIHKLERTARYWQQFKNLIYLIALEYYENNQDISVFTNQSVLDKIVKGKIRPEFTNEKIDVFVNQLVDLSTNILGADTIKAILRKVTHEYRATLKAWHKKQKHSLPKPVKLSKMTSFTFNTNPNMVIDKRYLKTKKQNAIVVRLAKSTAVKIKITKNLECDYISLVWNKDTPAKALLMYEVEKQQYNLDVSKWAAIDVGINNLVALVSNTNGDSILINGKPIKAFNQWYNKLLAKLQGDKSNHKIRQLSAYRKKRMRQYMGTIANYVIQYCLANDIGTLIISKSLTSIYQQKSKSKSNQTLRYIPLGMLLNMLEYKAAYFGINIQIVDESYTSKLSSISDDIGNVKDLSNYEPGGSRLKRGLYHDEKSNKVFNADLNGAFNIAMKFLRTRLLEQITDMKTIYRKLCNPVKVNLFSKYSVNPSRITDSTACVTQRKTSFCTI